MRLDPESTQAVFRATMTSALAAASVNSLAAAYAISWNHVCTEHGGDYPGTLLWAKRNRVLIDELRLSTGHEVLVKRSRDGAVAPKVYGGHVYPMLVAGQAAYAFHYAAKDPLPRSSHRSQELAGGYPLFPEVVASLAVLPDGVLQAFCIRHRPGVGTSGGGQFDYRECGLIDVVTINPSTLQVGSVVCADLRDLVSIEPEQVLAEWSPRADSHEDADDEEGPDLDWRGDEPFDDLP